MKINYDGVICEAETDEDIGRMIFAVMDLASAKMKWCKVAAELGKKDEKSPQ